MMRIQYLKSIVLLCLLSLIISCYDDEGNYDYKDLNRMGVELPFKNTVVSRGSVLDIIPKVAWYGDTLGDASRYEYSWTLMTQDVMEAKVWKIGDQRSLYSRVDVPAGEYLLVYAIKDKETDLEWKTSGFVTVKSEIAEGWLLMTESEEDGQIMADLDMYAKNLDNGTYYLVKKVLVNSNYPYRKGPRMVYHRATAPGTEVVPNGTKMKLIYILTDEASGWLDYQTQTWKDDQMIRFQMLEPVGNDFTVKRICCLDLSKVFAFTDKGDLMVYNAMTGGSVFAGYINFVIEKGEKVDFRVAPYLGGSSATGLSMMFPYILYDETNTRFIKCEFNPYSSGNAGCFKVQEEWGKKTGKKMRYMQSCGKAGDVYALLQESEGVYWQYKFTITQSISADVPYLIQAPHLKANSFVAYQNTYGHLYYTDGKVLYTYRKDVGEVEVKTMNAEITALACVRVTYDRNPEVDRCIAVATYDDTKEQNTGGILTTFMTESARPESVKLLDTYTGLGKVKSIDYLY